jgi:prepilin-type N-terminal cleavage/methylation domain-containing protein
LATLNHDIVNDRHRDPQGGFSLIEALVALAILALGGRLSSDVPAHASRHHRHGPASFLIETCSLPDDALLQAYARTGAYTDCY